MQSFVYTAREAKSGQNITAEIDAENEASAAQLLLSRGLTPIEIVPKRANHDFNYFVRRQLGKQRVIFSRQLATLVNAGLPLVQSLRAANEQTNNKAFNQVISKVINDVEAGSSLSQAMDGYPQVFNQVYVSLIAAGEASGTLDVSLERLATQDEKDTEMISRLRGALVYPIIVLLVMVGVVSFMMTAVLPQVEALYAGLPNARLPFVTRLMLGVSHFLLHYWLLILLLIIIVSFLSLRWIKTGPGRLFYDGWKLRAWGAGPLFRKLYMARFTRVSGTLVASGVPLLKVLSTSSKSVGNVHIEAAINRAAEKVEGGKSLSEALSGDKHFLDLVPSMIRTGEQSGTLDQMLAKLADYYEREVDNQIKSISSIVEPVLMIVVGVIALVVVAAVLLPIYSLAGKSFIKV